MDLGIQPVADFLGMAPVKGLFISPSGVTAVPWTHVTADQGHAEFGFTKGVDAAPTADMMVGVDLTGVIGCVMTATFRRTCRTNDGTSFYSRAIMPREALAAVFRSCEICGAADAPYGNTVYAARRGLFGLWYCREHRP